MTRRTFTGAWIETRSANPSGRTASVAPSQVRELKLRLPTGTGCRKLSHLHRCVNWNPVQTVLRYWSNCRTFTGAWIETFAKRQSLTMRESHLHRCVNWNAFAAVGSLPGRVAPSQVRELKLCFSPSSSSPSASHLHRCVNWNVSDRVFRSNDSSRTFTGAWIETIRFWFSFMYFPSHLHRCVNWNALVAWIA